MNSRLKFCSGSGVKVKVVRPLDERDAGGLRLALFDDFVEQRAVVGGDVLHIAHVLVAALNLEAAHAWRR